ncbi:hypothetical protein BGI33_06690 [Snodgrassella alvi]|nr:hypothetical protein BGI33_06690 [Snodgrassella alvi]PIT16297.1 hypothetical protein BGI34_09645 [Snodgrassella alvi]
MYASKWRFPVKKIVINTALPDYSNQTAMRFQTHGRQKNGKAGRPLIRTGRHKASLPLSTMGKVCQ